MSEFKAKMHQNSISARLGLCPRPRWGSAVRLPGFQGPTSQGREGKGKMRGVEGKGKERRGGIRGAYFEHAFHDIHNHISLRLAI